MSAPGGGLNASLDQSRAEHADPGGDKGPQSYPLDQRWQHVKQDQATYRNIDESVQHAERDIRPPSHSKDQRTERKGDETQSEERHRRPGPLLIATRSKSPAPEAKIRVRQVR